MYTDIRGPITEAIARAEPMNDRLFRDEEPVGRKAQENEDALLDMYANAITEAERINGTYQDAAMAERQRPWEIDREIVDLMPALQQTFNFCKEHKKLEYEMLALRVALDIISVRADYDRNMAAKPKLRAEIARNYEKFYAEIGQRDGFKCKRCKRKSNLAIDHIFALANGGTNELDNLQLLCRTCNSSKGAR